MRWKSLLGHLSYKLLIQYDMISYDLVISSSFLCCTININSFRGKSFSSNWHIFPWANYEEIIIFSKVETQRTTGINHIKVFVADQILIGRCFKGFEWSWYFEGQREYSFDCKIISDCLDKNIALPLLWRDMHIYKKWWHAFHSFRSKYL
jgi:hypothetical protein